MFSTVDSVGVRYAIALFAIAMLACACTRTVETDLTGSTESPSTAPSSTALTPTTSTDIAETMPTTTTAPVRDVSLFEPLGAADCAPPSPFLDWHDGDGANSGLAEIRATSAEVEVWGLLWETPPLPVDVEIKMVWRVTGSGIFKIRAFKGGEETELTWGPAAHGESNFGRPGDEWGTAFVFPSPGCWNIEIVRGDDNAHIWVEVSAQPST